MNQYIDTADNLNEKSGLMNSNRLLMTNESLNNLKDFNMTNVNFSGIIPSRTNNSVLISNQNDLEKLRKDLLSGMTKQAYN